MINNNISSKNNPKIKLAKSLYQRKFRKKHRKFLVEGINHVGVAYESNAIIDFVIYSDNINKSRFGKDLIDTLINNNTPCFLVPEKIYADLSNKENTQSIIAVVENISFIQKSEDLEPEKLMLCLINPQNPGNLGTIMRTMDGVDIKNLIIVGDSVDPYHLTCIRASMGAIFNINILKSTFLEFSNWTKINNISVYGTSANGEKPFNEFNYEYPSILLMGSEQKGLTETELLICSEVLMIPMKGKGTSLNLSVATSIILYEIKNKLT